MQGQGIQMKLQSAILQALEADQKQTLSASSKQQTELVNKMKQKWGFLQNIINIDKFFSSKKDSKHTDKFESFASLKKKYDRVERDFLKDSGDDKKNTDISVTRNAKKDSIKTADEADSGAKEDGEKAKEKKEEPKKEEPKKEEKKEEAKKEGSLSQQSSSKAKMLTQAQMLAKDSNSVSASEVIQKNLLPDQNDIRVAHVQEAPKDKEDKEHEKEIKKIEDKIEKAKETETSYFNFVT